jgi:hypothetical protein
MALLRERISKWERWPADGINAAAEISGVSARPAGS